jgi:ATP-dependent helicase/DNAse subunit B
MANDNSQDKSNVICFTAFKAAAEAWETEQQNVVDHNASVLEDVLRSRQKFTAFDMLEQKAIMSLHAEFSAASRDYDHKYENGRAFIALLACSQTREELVRIAKLVDENAEQGYKYQASGACADNFESQELQDVINHAKQGLALRVKQELNNFTADAKRVAFSVITK